MLNVATRTPATPVRRLSPAERRRLAEQAHCCARWLEINGFVVLRIEQNHAQPRIFIRACPLCDQLEGAITHFERGIGFQRRYKRVTRLDCEIRWSEGTPK